MKYRIIDAHAHVFPDDIAQKAADSITGFYDFKLTHAASVQNLLREGETVGADKFLVCSAAVSKHQTESINNFMHELNKDERFVALGTIHPGNINWSDELDRVKELGLHGIKLHPDFQRFNIDDDKMIPIYKKTARLGLPILFHIGDNRSDGSSPSRLARVMKQVPDLVAIAAHMGGYRSQDEAYKVLPISDNLFFDTSSALGFISKDTALKIIERFGVGKFMFGTDFPIWHTKDEYENVLSLGLSDSENVAVFSENFCRLFKL